LLVSFFPQLGPGVNMFRRRVISGMPGHGQAQGGSAGTSALSITPKDDSPQEPSETIGEMEDEEDSGAPMPSRMASMEQRLKRIEDMLQQMMDHLDR